MSFSSCSWNLEVSTNVIMYEREMSNDYPPHPEVEQARAQKLSRLRQQYDEMCMSREGMCVSHLHDSPLLILRQITWYLPTHPTALVCKCTSLLLDMASPFCVPNLYGFTNYYGVTFEPVICLSRMEFDMNAHVHSSAESASQWHL